VWLHPGDLGHPPASNPPAELRTSSTSPVAGLALRLTDQSTPITRGSRLRLTLGTASADLLYLQYPLQQGVKVTIGRVRLTMPVLRHPISR